LIQQFILGLKGGKPPKPPEEGSSRALAYVPVDDYNELRGYGSVWTTSRGDLGPTDSQWHEFHVGQVISLDIQNRHPLIGSVVDPDMGLGSHIGGALESRYQDETPYDDDDKEADEFEYGLQEEVALNPRRALEDLSDANVEKVADDLNITGSFWDRREELMHQASEVGSDANLAVVDMLRKSGSDIYAASYSERLVPAVFTFPEGYHGQENEVHPLSPKLTGLYTVRKIRTHSFITDQGNIAPEGTQGKLKGWMEVQLIPL